MNAYYVDGHPVSSADGIRWGHRWFHLLQLPPAEDVGGPFTPVEIARHRSWGLAERYNRSAVYAPMWRNDTDGAIHWPQSECDPAEVASVGAKYGYTYRAAVVTYDRRATA